MFFISLESTSSVEIIWQINSILRVKNRLLRIGLGVCNAVAVLVTFPCTELSGNKKTNVACLDSSSSELLCQWKVCSPSHITGNPVSPEEVVGTHSSGPLMEFGRQNKRESPNYSLKTPKIVLLCLL